MTFSLQIAKMVSILVAQESGGGSESRLFAAATAITLIKLRLDRILPATDESVPLGREGNVPLREVGHPSSLHGNITKQSIEDYAIQMHRASGNGITYVDIEHSFSVKKSQAQRTLKHFHRRRVLFTAQDLICKGINLIPNKNQQDYFPTSIKSDIIENLKKRSAPVMPTGVNPSRTGLTTCPTGSEYPSNTLESDKAQSFLDVLIQLPFAPPYIHKLHLMLSIDRAYYQELAQKEGHRNRGKVHEEIIGRRLVKYIFSPNGTVEAAVRSNDTPFRLETEEDECEIVSFLGEVKDRLLYHVSDIRERGVPPVIEWVLKQCDLNKDIEISDKAQITLPDIQLKYAQRVFRLYVKSLKGKAVYRAEESLTLHNAPNCEALRSIRNPNESMIEELSETVKGLVTMVNRVLENLPCRHRIKNC